MRLFEVDQGAARDVLAVFRGIADRKGQSLEVPFQTVLNLLRPFGLGINSPDALIDLKNQIDPNGNVISDILDNGTVILKTRSPSQTGAEENPQAGKKTELDRMASRAAKKLEPDL